MSGFVSWFCFFALAACFSFLPLLGQGLSRRDKALLLNLRVFPSEVEVSANGGPTGIITGVVFRTKARDQFLLIEKGIAFGSGGAIDDEMLFTQKFVRSLRLSGLEGDTGSAGSGSGLKYWNCFHGLQSGVRVKGESPRIFFGSTGNYDPRRPLVYLVRLSRNKDAGVRCLEVDGSASSKANGWGGDLPDLDCLVPCTVVRFAAGVREIVPKGVLEPGEYGVWVPARPLDLAGDKYGVLVGRIYSFCVD